MNHQCEECGYQHTKYDLLIDKETGIKYLFCEDCALQLIKDNEAFDYLETIHMDEKEEEAPEFKYVMTKDGRLARIPVNVSERPIIKSVSEETPEEREQKRQRLVQEKVEKAFKVLNDFVGMKQIKADLKQLLVQKEAKEYIKKHTNLEIEAPLMHTILAGSSGTGKTELAKKLAHIYYNAGIISQEKIVFVKTEDIVGKYVGHTGPKTKEKIDEAEGGIFFLDEAYRLAEGGERNDGGDFGLEAIETIMGAMENDSDVVFVFAGYPDKMQNFLEKNEGLSSRIPNVLTLQDYTESELLEIALAYLQKRRYKTEKMEQILQNYIRENMTHGMLKGNGRTVRNYVDKIINKHLERIMWTEDKTAIDLEEVYPEDVHAAFEKTMNDQERLKTAYQLAKGKINAMTGLQEVKDQLQEIGDYQYIQEKRKKVGLPTQKKSHHMFFLGAPGTGKTTMARLVGELFRGTGVLSNGHFIEATKEKLTKGESIPSTVQNLINKAKGGVLFIDEAYALANDGKGKEALDSLIAHIENEREDLVVIMAGYKEDMQRLMELNEGLASRIPYHLEFASYATEELTEIAFDLFTQHQFVLTKEATENLIALIHEAKENEWVNGNARWVRNLFEQTQLLQSKRLVQKELEEGNNTKEDFQTITQSDIVAAKDKIHIFSSQKQEKTEENERKALLRELEEHFEEVKKMKKVI